MRRDKLYEQEQKKNIKLIMQVLDDFSKKDLSEWKFVDTLACQRAIQIAIESLIGLARYVVELKHNIRVSKSREAIEELYKLNSIDKNEYESIIKIIGFRNVLVHDYLKIEDEIVTSVIKQKKHLEIETFMQKLIDELG